VRPGGALIDPAGGGTEHPLALDRIVAAVAEGVAAEYPPAGQDDPAQHPETADGVDGVL
jgi:hypothetical protein